METIEIILSGFITVFSLGLLAIAVRSYIKFKNVKLLFIGLIFLIFLIKGLILSINIFYPGYLLFDSIFYVEFFDIVILILIFISTLKR